MTDPSQKQPPFLQFDPEMRRLVLALGYMLVTGGVVFALISVWPVISLIFNVLSPFIVALVLAYIFNPIVNFVQQRLRLTRIGGVIVVNLIIILTVAGFVAIIIPILTFQTKSAYRDIRDTIEERVIPWATNFILEVPAHENALVLSDFQSYFNSNKETLPSKIDSPELNQFLRQWQVVSVRNDDHTNDFSTHITEWADGHTTESITVELVQQHVNELKEISDNQQKITWQDLYQRLDKFLASQGINSNELVERALSSNQVRTAAKSAAEGGAGIFANIIELIISGIATLLGSFIFLTFILILSFYLLVDFSSITGLLEVVCPKQHQERMFTTLTKIDIAVGGFIRGQLISAALVGLLVFIGLYCLGLQQYALLIGFVAGFGNLVPYLGTIVGATPAVLYMLFTSDFETMQERGIYLMITIGLFMVIQTIDGFIFQPKIVGQSAQLHPIAVIIALAFGAQFGLVGMIIAVPMMCILRVVWKEFFWDKRAEEWRKTTGKLHYGDLAPKPKKSRKQIEGVNKK